MQDELMHWGKGQEAPNHKYISKEWVNGAWQYIYNRAQKAKKAATGAAIRAKNDVAAARNKASRALSVRSGKSVTSDDYNREAIKNSLKTKKSQVRSGVNTLRSKQILATTRGKMAARDAANKVRSGVNTLRSKQILATTRGKMAARNAANEAGNRVRSGVNTLRSKQILATTRAKIKAKNGASAIGKRAVGAWNSIVSNVRRRVQSANIRRKNKNDQDHYRSVTSNYKNMMGTPMTGTSLKKRGIYASRKPR